MVKKISVLALAGLLALPGAALAAGSGDLEAKIAELTRQLEELKAQVTTMDEKSEEWDLASRIKISGDVRSRLDGVKADSPSYFSALNVASGVADVLDAGQVGFPIMLGDFAATPATLLSVLMAGLPATPALFVTAATTDTNADGSTATTTQATDIAAIFYNQAVQAMLTQMIVDSGNTVTVGDLAASFADTQSLVALMKNLPAADRKSIFANLTGG